jgi:hypothetical protein
MLKEIRLFKRKMLEKRAEATRNFKNPGNLSNSKKEKTCYNSGNKGHYKRECMFQKK